MSSYINRINQQLKNFVIDEAMSLLSEVAEYLTNQPQWIPVSQQLPELDQEVNVLLVHPRRPVATMRFQGMCEDTHQPIWYWQASSVETSLRPVAWMPLPKPPNNSELSS